MVGRNLSYSRPSFPPATLPPWADAGATPWPESGRGSVLGSGRGEARPYRTLGRKDPSKHAGNGRGFRHICNRSSANARAPRRQGKAAREVDILLSAAAGDTVRDQPRWFVAVVDRRRSRCNRHNPGRQLMPASLRQGDEEKNSSGLRNPVPGSRLRKKIHPDYRPEFVVTIVHGRTSPACGGS